MNSMDLGLLKYVGAMITWLEQRKFRFEVTGVDLDIIPPSGFGDLSDEDMDWFKRHKTAVVFYLQTHGGGP